MSPKATQATSCYRKRVALVNNSKVIYRKTFIDNPEHGLQARGYLQFRLDRSSSYWRLAFKICMSPKLLPPPSYEELFRCRIRWKSIFSSSVLIPIPLLWLDDFPARRAHHRGGNTQLIRRNCGPLSSPIVLEAGGVGWKRKRKLLIKRRAKILRFWMSTHWAKLPLLTN